MLLSNAVERLGGLDALRDCELTLRWLIIVAIDIVTRMLAVARAHP